MKVLIVILLVVALAIIFMALIVIYYIKKLQAYNKWYKEFHGRKRISSYSYYIPRCRIAVKHHTEDCDRNEFSSHACGYWRKVYFLKDIPLNLRKAKQYRTHYD